MFYDRLQFFSCFFCEPTNSFQNQEFILCQLLSFTVHFIFIYLLLVNFVCKFVYFHSLMQLFLSLYNLFKLVNENTIATLKVKRIIKVEKMILSPLFILQKIFYWLKNHLCCWFVREISPFLHDWVFRKVTVQTGQLYFNF